MGGQLGKEGQGVRHVSLPTEPHQPAPGLAALSLPLLPALHLPVPLSLAP